MNKQKLFLVVTVLALMAGTVGFLAWFHTHQKLGLPGVKTSPIAGSDRLRVDLPENVTGWTSELRETDDIVLGVLPADTSFGQRLYKAPDDFSVVLNVVLMGVDRTSLHKPQFCLEGQGWRIDQTASTQPIIRMERPFPYALPVVKLIATREAMLDGHRQTLRGVYVYWFVADGAMSASVSGIQRMWMLALNMLRTGVLQRWAYVSYFAVCAPGQEDATYERMSRFIAQSVPEFQLVPRAGDKTMAASR